jgi:hypothetical protein
MGGTGRAALQLQIVDPVVDLHVSRLESIDVRLEFSGPLEARRGGVGCGLILLQFALQSGFNRHSATHVRVQSVLQLYGSIAPQIVLKAI